jgi:hypothetical protein
MIMLLRNVKVQCASDILTVVLQYQCCRSDGPLKDVLFTSGTFKVDLARIFITKAKDLIHAERGCLALIVDSSEISACTQILRTFFRMYHNLVVGTMTPAKTEDGEMDKRYQGFFDVRLSDCFQIEETWTESDPMRNINDNLFSAHLFQGEILVLVGFATDSFPADEARVFAQTHKLFFNNILSNCGPIRKGNDRPYNSKLAEALMIAEDSLGRKQSGPLKGQLFLPVGFYSNLLNMLADNPMLKGMNRISPTLMCLDRTSFYDSTVPHYLCSKYNLLLAVLFWGT